MSTTPTNLSVPSEKPQDLKFNAGKIDEFVTSFVNTYIDRFGNEHYTIEGLRWLAQQAISQYGWIPVGTFQDGATLTLPNQILKDTTDEEYYRWDGSFLPSGKIVPPGSTPSTAGGVGVGAWLSVGDSLLRTELTGEKGFLLPGGQQERFYDLRAFVEAGDPVAPDYTQAFKRAIASGNGRVFVNVPVEFTEDLTIPAKFRVDIGECGYLYTNTAKVRIEGFINTIGGNDPYRGYIHPFGVDSSTVPGIYTMPVTLMVPEDYPTVQDAVDVIPNNYWQRIVISIADNYGNTGAPEDVVVRSKRGSTPLFPPGSSQQAGIKIGSRSADPSKVSLNSIQVLNCGGTPYSPSIERINFKGRTHSDENASIEFYGCTSGGVLQCSFNGAGVDKCIEAYNSIISVDSADFGNNINKAGLVTKHGGVINYNATQLGNLPISTGVLKEYVALPIGGVIIASDFSPVIGKLAQSYADGVMSGFAIEVATKSITGVTSPARLDTTHFQTFFENWDRFSNSTTAPADQLNYLPEDGLYFQAASTGRVSHKIVRPKKLNSVEEYQNYRAFAIEISRSSSSNGLLITGGYESGNYVGFRLINGELRGVVAINGSETYTTIATTLNTLPLTVKYSGKGKGMVQFFIQGVYAGHIQEKKLPSFDGVIFHAILTGGNLTLHEMNFISSM